MSVQVHRDNAIYIQQVDGLQWLIKKESHDFCCIRFFLAAYLMKSAWQTAGFAAAWSPRGCWSPSTCSPPLWPGLLAAGSACPAPLFASPHSSDLSPACDSAPPGDWSGWPPEPSESAPRRSTEPWEPSEVIASSWDSGPVSLPTGAAWPPAVLYPNSSLPFSPLKF